MYLYDSDYRIVAEVLDVKHWDRPPRRNRSKYCMTRMDQYFYPKVNYLTWPIDAEWKITQTEAVLRILDHSPKKFFHGTHLRRYERELKERLFEERLTNK